MRDFHTTLNDRSDVKVLFFDLILRRCIKEDRNFQEQLSSKGTMRYSFRLSPSLPLGLHGQFTLF